MLLLSWAEDEDNDVWKWLAALRAHNCRMRGLFGNFLKGSACSCWTIIGSSSILILAAGWSCPKSKVHSRLAGQCVSDCQPLSCSAI